MLYKTRTDKPSELDKPERTTLQNQEIPNDRVVHASLNPRSSVYQMSSMIVPVTITSNTQDRKQVIVYVLLDNQSDTTFITEDVASKLAAIGETTSLTV